MFITLRFSIVSTCLITLFARFLLYVRKRTFFPEAAFFFAKSTARSVFPVPAFPSIKRCLFKDKACISCACSLVRRTSLFSTLLSLSDSVGINTKSPLKNCTISLMSPGDKRLGCPCCLSSQ